MELLGGPGKRILWRAASAMIALALTNCVTTGHSFNAGGLSRIIAGQTTYIQAQELLQAAPVDIYQQGDGSTLARWAHKHSLATDAIYLRQELLLMFDAYGRFERVVDSVNVSGQPASIPGTPQNVVQKPAGWAVGDNGPPNPLAEASARGIENPIVVYPLAAQ